jgi:hypothetical protein
MLLLLSLFGLLGLLRSSVTTAEWTAESAEWTAESAEWTAESAESAECLPSQAAHEALGAAWDPYANHTVPCGIRKQCPGILSSFTSSFTAAANARINATRGVLEFNKMMEAQWSTGFLPHAYFPELPERDSNRSPVPPPGLDWHGLTPGDGWWGGKPQTNMDEAPVWTSGIASPPIQATAALQIYLYLYHAKPSGTSAHDFLRRAFTRLYAWHAYLHKKRDNDGDGLVYIRHPWESPLAWNSSSVAAALARVNVSAIDPSLVPINSTAFPDSLRRLPGFPGDAEYSRMLAIAKCQGSLKWNDRAISDTNISRGTLGSPCGFLVEDIAFNALLLRADVDLMQIGDYLLQDKQELGYDSDIQNKQLEIQGWIRLMTGKTALGANSLVRDLPETDVAGGAVMISRDLGHLNASHHDPFDIGAIFSLVAADQLVESVVSSLSATALSPLFWTRYPLSDSVASEIGKAVPGDASCGARTQERPLVSADTGRGTEQELASESAVSMHVVGMLVQAWSGDRSGDIQGDARSTLSVLANFMSSQARVLFPECPNADKTTLYFDRYGSNTGHALPSVAEFGAVMSSPRAAAVSVILNNLTLPSAPPIPPIGLGLTTAIMWVELAFAFTVGTSCIVLALYHIRLLAKEDEQEDAAATAGAGYQSMEDDTSSGRTRYTPRGGETDLMYGTGEDSDDQSSKNESADDINQSVMPKRSSSGRLSAHNFRDASQEPSEWSWPLSYIFGGQPSISAGAQRASSPSAQRRSSRRSGEDQRREYSPALGSKRAAAERSGRLSERLSDTDSDSDYRSTDFGGV